MNNVNSEVYADISVIISMMPTDMKNKISANFINFIENNKAKDYVSNINPQIPINKQNIRKETRILMGIIYREYLCNNEEKEKLLKEEEKEFKKIEEELRKEYNSDNMFKNRKTTVNNTQTANSDNKNKQLAVIKKVKWYKKVWKSITKFFRR